MENKSNNKQLAYDEGEGKKLIISVDEQSLQAIAKENMTVSFRFGRLTVIEGRSNSLERTVQNINSYYHFQFEKLVEFMFWIADGTFSAVPKLFKQIIHYSQKLWFFRKYISIYLCFASE